MRKIPRWQIEQATGGDPSRINGVEEIIKKNKPTLIFHEDREIHDRIVKELEQRLNPNKILKETVKTVETKESKTPSPKKREKTRQTLQGELQALVIEYESNKKNNTRDDKERLLINDVRDYSSVIQNIVDKLSSLTSLKGTTPQKKRPTATTTGSQPKVTYELTKMNGTNWQQMVERSGLTEDLQGVLTQNTQDFTSRNEILLRQPTAKTIPMLEVTELLDDDEDVLDEPKDEPTEYTIPDDAKLFCARCLEALDNDVGWTGGGGFDGLCCKSHRICNQCWWYHSNPKENTCYITEEKFTGARQFEDPSTRGREWCGTTNDTWSLDAEGIWSKGGKLAKQQCTFYCFYNNTTEITTEITAESTAESTTESTAKTTTETTTEQTKSGKYRPVFRF